jgi:tryptophan-rich sensory protein
MTFRGVSAALGIILVLIYAVGSGIWVSNAPGWYTSLVKPSWQPPDFVFGLIWPYNFIMLGLASFKVSQTLSRNAVFVWLGLFTLSIIAALTWAYQFYLPHNLTIATYALGTAALLTLPVLYLTFQSSVIFGLLLVPYQLWVIIATTLAWGYSVRN